ncbi:MAG TPA: hypothetical protein PLX73_01325 [Candidatus Paceibacterota bacterium]|nr:hypothetical protein [Candidatus Paceibacterota bacterium]HOL54063.1 hypothetical protein [Candidatus Paceibacterota bacterium]HON21904.1 hypothetical protein [Candidatus Paceibacterota bacterium]HPP17006.1 hypothetical protein [Candidatus Paceibacterota bacterium]HRU33612.1 hypothetical protein [Candidatus Paceibacterota bacterium]
MKLYKKIIHWIAYVILCIWPIMLAEVLFIAFNIKFDRFWYWVIAAIFQLGWLLLMGMCRLSGESDETTEKIVEEELKKKK